MLLQLATVLDQKVWPAYLTPEIRERRWKQPQKIPPRFVLKIVASVTNLYGLLQE